MNKLFNLINLRLIYVVVLSILIITNTSNAQLTSKGREFWISAMEMKSTCIPELDFLTLSISADVETNGTISIPGVGWNQNFYVNSNSTIIIKIQYDSVLIKTSDSITNCGIHIATDKDINVSALIDVDFSKDAQLVLPINALSNNYYVISYAPKVPDLDTAYSHFSIIATSDSTKIRIVPTKDILSTGNRIHQKGIPYEITLQKGEVYFAKSFNDLTGTYIYSIAKKSNFAVFCGTTGSYIPNPNKTGWANPLLEQMLPINTSATTYYTVPLKTRLKGDLFRIFAIKDSTAIHKNKEFIQKLNKGEFFDINISEPSIISSDKPIIVSQYSYCSTFDDVMLSDPSYVILNDKYQSMNNITFEEFPFYKNTIYTTADPEYYINIITETSMISDIFLDGISIENEFKKYDNDPNLSYAQITTTEGSHKLIGNNNASFNAYVYGFYAFDAYLYSAGFCLSNQEIDDTPPNLSFLNNSCGIISYLVTDSTNDSINIYTKLVDKGIKSIILVDSNNVNMFFVTSKQLNPDTIYYEFIIKFKLIDPLQYGSAIIKLTDNAENISYDTLSFMPNNDLLIVKSQLLNDDKTSIPGDTIIINVSISCNDWGSFSLNKFSYVYAFKTKWMLYKDIILSSDLDNSWIVTLDSSKNIGDSTYLFISGRGTSPIQSNSLITQLKFYLLYDNCVEYYPTIESFFTDVINLDSCFSYFINNGIIKLNVCASDIMKIIITNTNYYLNINPNPTTNNELNLNYGIGLDSYIKIDLYNSLGNSVKQIYNSEIKSGTYSDKININDLSAGVYYIKIESGPYIETKKIMILK